MAKPFDIDAYVRLKELEEAKGITPNVVKTPTTKLGVPVVSAPVAPDYSSYINQITEAQKAKTIADYQNAYQKSLGGLNEQEAKIAPAYQQDRTNLQTTNTMEAKRLENLLAQRGLASAGAGETMSGAGSQRNLAQSIGFQGAMSSNQLAERQALDEMAKRKTELGTDLNYNIASANSAADIQALQSQFQARQQADEIARRSQETLDTRAYNEGLTAQENAREDAKTAADRTREDFINTIGGIRDYTAQINTVQNDGDQSNDWQIPFLQQARQEKIVNQNLDPRTGLPLPVDTTPQITSSSAAIDLWKQLGTANQSIANALGIPVGTRYTAQASGSSGGSRSTSGSSVTTPATTSTPKQIISYAESQLRGTGGSSAADRLVALNDTGVMDNLTPAEIKTLMNKFGVTEQMIAQAENRIEAQTSGVTLPSGRVTVPTNPNLLVR